MFETKYYSYLYIKSTLYQQPQKKWNNASIFSRFKSKQFLKETTISICRSTTTATTITTTPTTTTTISTASEIFDEVTESANNINENDQAQIRTSTNSYIEFKIPMNATTKGKDTKSVS